MYTLTHDEAVELVEAARQGDRDAWADLAEACDGYARKLAAGRAGGDDVLFEDLYQVAVGDGLWAAIESWDPRRGKSFGSWAWQKMNSAVWGEARSGLAHDGRGVELALDGVVEVGGEEGEVPLAETLPDDAAGADEICIAGECQWAVRNALAQAAEQTELPGVHGEREVEAQVAIAGSRLLSEEPMGLSELGNLLGLTPQRVGQIEVELVDRVREIVIDSDPDDEEE